MQYMASEPYSPRSVCSVRCNTIERQNWDIQRGIHKPPRVVFSVDGVSAATGVIASVEIGVGVRAHGKLHPQSVAIVPTNQTD